MCTYMPTTGIIVNFEKGIFVSRVGSSALSSVSSPLNAELRVNSAICWHYYHHILHVSRIMVSPYGVTGIPVI